MQNIITFTLPSRLAAYLFNGEAEDITETEKRDINVFLLQNNLGFCLDVAGDKQFMSSNDFNNIPCECETFTFENLQERVELF